MPEEVIRLKDGTTIAKSYYFLGKELPNIFDVNTEADKAWLLHLIEKAKNPSLTWKKESYRLQSEELGWLDLYGEKIAENISEMLLKFIVVSEETNEIKFVNPRIIELKDGTWVSWELYLRFRNALDGENIPDIVKVCILSDLYEKSIRSSFEMNAQTVSFMKQHHFLEMDENINTDIAQIILNSVQMENGTITKLSDPTKALDETSQVSQSTYSLR